MLSDHFFGFDCSYCGAMASHYCEDCAQVGYCSDECADQHWGEEHWRHHDENEEVTVEDIKKNYDLQEIEEDGTHIWTLKPELIERRGGRRRGGHRPKKWMQGVVKHPGSFKRAAKKRHMSTAAFASKILHDTKHSRYTMHRFRQAQLYRRFKSAKHHRGRRKGRGRRRRRP